MLVGSVGTRATMPTIYGDTSHILRLASSGCGEAALNHKGTKWRSLPWDTLPMIQKRKHGNSCGRVLGGTLRTVRGIQAPCRQSVER